MFDSNLDVDKLRPIIKISVQKLKYLQNPYSKNKNNDHISAILVGEKKLKYSMLKCKMLLDLGHKHKH